MATEALQTDTDERADDSVPTTDDVVAGLAALRSEMQRAVDAMVDDIDMPGAWTERQKNAYREARYRLNQHTSICSNVAESLTKAAAALKWMLPARDRLRPVKAEIERQIADVPDWQRITDRWEEKREWERQRGLTSSLKMINGTVGVDFFGGQPALASPLKELLSDVCPHADCPHRGAPYIFWVGALPQLEIEIAEAEQVIAAHRGLLAGISAEAARYLATARTTI